MGDERTYAEVRAEAARWIQRHWHPGLTVGRWWVLLAESGWGFPGWPTRWFGRDLPPHLCAAVREAFLAAGVLGPPSGLGQLLGAPTLFAHGTAEQLREFIPPLAYGRESWCQFFSEPEAGSDLAALRTRAMPRDGGWQVDGQKVWTSKAHLADRGMLLARTDPDAPKHRGITYLIIDVRQPGIQVRPLRQMNGGSEFDETFFTSAWVPPGRVVGTVGDGWRVAVTTLATERLMKPAPSVDPGVTGGMLDMPVAEAMAVRTEGVAEGWGSAPAAPTIIDLARRAGSVEAGTRRSLAGLWALEEVERLHGLREGEAERAGGEAVHGSVRKLTRSEIARQGRDIGLGALGAGGLLSGVDAPGEGVVAQLAVSCPSASIAGGTDEIQRNIIGERVLGLPREPQVDRDVPFREIGRTAKAAS